MLVTSSTVCICLPRAGQNVSERNDFVPRDQVKCLLRDKRRSLFKERRAFSRLKTRIVRGKTQSSQLAEPLWTDLVLKNGISVRDLISTLKKKN